MKKIYLYIAVLVGLSTLASVARAQVYYPNYYPTSCVSISRNIGYGSYGQDVSTLQAFLVSQGYLATTPTGYFGNATLRAVTLYQSNHDIPATGYVGALTRASVQSNCGGNGNYNNGSVSINSLSTTSGPAGTYVTIYGTGFDSYNNTVNFGNTTEGGIQSNGSSLSFVVPQINNNNSCISYFPNNQYNNFYDPNCYNNQNTTYNISVTTSHGTSNTLSFNYTGNNNNYNGYGNPTISYITPTSGGPGTYVTVYGTNFSSTNNTVYFGGTQIYNVSSSNGTSLSFTVPYQLNNYNYQNITTGNYNIYVTNASGYTSNSVSFYVNSNNNNNGGLSFGNINGPTTLGLNNQGTWYVTINNPYNSYSNVSVNWGDSNNNGSNNQTVNSQGQQTLTFTHTYYTSGTYTVTFTLQNGNGNSITSSTNVFVNAGYNNSGVSISYLSPNQARVGTQIMIQGSGFTQYGNTVHFGNGGSLNVQSYNGSTIYYTIPYQTTGCDLSTGGTCATYAQQITPGSYPIYITNSNGTSNTLYFTVTN